jgi:peptide/nickel transport system substrate-binding protein
MNAFHPAVGAGPAARRVIGRRPWCLLAVVAAATLAFFASGASAGRSALPVLRIGVPFHFDQFWNSPALFRSTGGALNTEMALTYAPLFHMKPSGQIAPALATSWRTFSTGRGANKDFEFTLRHDANFSDGTPVNAVNVAQWLTWYAANSVSYGGVLGPKPEFTAVGPWKVRARLTFPSPGFFSILSDAGLYWGFVGAPRCIATPSLFATQTCGAGPFTMDASQTVKGDHYTYVANPYYYDKKNLKWSEVDLKVIVQSTSLLQALQAGQLDVVTPNTDPSGVQAAAAAGLKVYYASTNQWVVLLHANNNPASPLNDLRVRQAFNYAIDRKAICSAVGFGLGRPTSEWFSGDAFDPKYQNMYPYDPNKAKQLLAAAGHSDGFTFKTFTFNPGQVQMAQLLANYLEPLNIHEQITPGALGGASTFLQTPANLISASTAPTSLTYSVYLDPKSANNSVGSDATLNQLYYQGLKAKDASSVWKKMWGRATQQAYFAPVCMMPIVWYATKSIGGINVSKVRTGSIFAQELYSR